jgi:hypothetical protein
MARWPVAVLAAVLVAGCSAGSSAGSARSPRYEPVGLTVVVSADGRVITAIGMVMCGHAQRLVALSYPGKVALVLENPDRRCKDIGSAPAITQLMPARARLPEPMGNRALVRVGSTRGTMPYFSERDLASVRRLPFGLRLSSDEPANVVGAQGQPEIGDTRRYMSPVAIMQVTQIVPRGWCNTPSCSTRCRSFSAGLPFGPSAFQPDRYRPALGSGVAADSEAAASSRPAGFRTPENGRRIVRGGDGRAGQGLYWRWL